MVHKTIIGQFLSLILLFTACNKVEEPLLIPVNSTTMMNGLSFTGPVNEIMGDELDPMVNIHSNYIALMPFGFGNFGETELRFNTEWQWWGEKDEGIIECTEYAKARKMKVFLKPHIWFSHGTFTGDFELNSEADWQEWETNYSAYILHYAMLADSINIDMLAIGVELKSFILHRPDFWISLIDSVRQVYSGTITYAANWDNYTNVPFWDKLDLIGIDAYFPLSDQKTPDVEDLKSGWTEHFDAMHNFSLSKNKKVIFTEYGYKSIDYTAFEPWNPVNSGNVNLQAQVNAYEALFQKFWEEDWFDGGFLWKWFEDHETAGGPQNKDYTPQNKPVEDIISIQYSKNK
jgi:hypothetical protein